MAGRGRGSPALPGGGGRGGTAAARGPSAGSLLPLPGAPEACVRSGRSGGGGQRGEREFREKEKREKETEREGIARGRAGWGWGGGGGVWIPRFSPRPLSEPLDLCALPSPWLAPSGSASRSLLLPPSLTHKQNGGCCSFALPSPRREAAVAAAAGNEPREHGGRGRHRGRGQPCGRGHGGAGPGGASAHNGTRAPAGWGQRHRPSRRHETAFVQSALVSLRALPQTSLATPLKGEGFFPLKKKKKGRGEKKKKKKKKGLLPAPPHTPLSVGPKVRGVGPGEPGRTLWPPRCAGPPGACCPARWAEAPGGRARVFRRRPPSFPPGRRLPAGSPRRRRAGRSCRRSRAVLRHRYGSPGRQHPASEQRAWGAGPAPRAPRGGRVDVRITQSQNKLD
ncbi:collagen alpha-1(I) chain-like [Anomalospiza imberbis]|uniref:collagen alpha-1(I) chain-like n=1 Tax=Anomalospiza imberbis TaxID=187417 RepID=UPI00358DFF4B